jgi:hexosaminidase
MQEDQPPVDQQHTAKQQQLEREGTPPAAAAAAAAASICRRACPTAAAYHGGYYSTADVAAVVKYAAEHCIQVVPEVELPGHCCAALAAYPNLSCEQRTRPVPVCRLRGASSVGVVA